MKNISKTVKQAAIMIVILTLIVAGTKTTQAQQIPLIGPMFRWFAGVFS